MAEAEDHLVAGRYRLSELIASGGQGAVWRGTDQRLHRPVAVKFPRFDVRSDPGAVERFRREARALARLRHPNVLSILDCGETDGRPWLVMPWLAGCTLDAALRKRAFTPAEAADLTARIASAVHYVHGLGLLHRDLKPANIFLESDGNPLVMDFGLVRDLDAKAGLTVEGELIGTPGFVAPEQAGGAAAVDARADVYSLGVILYMLLARRMPYEGTPLAIIRAGAEQDAPPPGNHQPGIPLELQAICLQALSRDPSRRFPTAGALAEALQVRRADPAFLRRVRRRRSWLAVRAWLARRSPWWAAAVAAAVTVVAWWFWPDAATGPLPPVDVVVGPPGTAGQPGKSSPPPGGGKTGQPAGSNGEPGGATAPGANWPDHLAREAARFPDRRPRWTADEPVTIGSGAFLARFRLTASGASVLRSDVIPAGGDWIVGEVVLVPRPAGEAAGVDVGKAGPDGDVPDPPGAERVPLVFARFADGWYADPLALLLAGTERARGEAGPGAAAALLEAVFVERRACAGRGVRVLHVARGAGESAASATLLRAWFLRPRFHATAARPAVPAKVPPGHPEGRAPTAEIREGAGDISALRPGADRCVRDLLAFADRAAGGDAVSRLTGARLLMALGIGVGRGTGTDQHGAEFADPALRSEAARRLRERWPEVAGDAPSPDVRRMLSGGRTGELIAALSPAAETADDLAAWEAFTAALVQAAARRSTAGDAGTAEELRRWVVDCFAGPSGVVTPTAKALRGRG